MIELEAYAVGIRDPDKVLALSNELDSLPGLRHKVDLNHDIVYLEMDEPLYTADDVRRVFRNLGVTIQFVGAIPIECRPKSKTQLLEI